MVKRSKKKRKLRRQASAGSDSAIPSAPWTVQTLASAVWLPLLLAFIAFLVYLPSLQSGFVYDSHLEILEENFVTSLANLPDILTFKVLGMHLILADRPGQLLYLMLIAAVSGKEPFGYHFCSNLLHAVNVALVYVLLLRLTKIERPDLTANETLRVKLAVTALTLLFALHPLVTETVSAVNYSSDLLTTFFTLVALLAAISFHPGNLARALTAGSIGTLCAFAAVACKESGLQVAALLIVYWFLFRRREARGPWLWFLGSAVAVTVAFLIARFQMAAAPLTPQLPSYLGGSFSQLLLIQPRLWVFMMGKTFWPFDLSADYTLDNLGTLSTPFSLVVLALVVGLQAWLSFNHRLAALGVAIYWLALVTVSNFIPLYCIEADRYYYFPLIGLAMQFLTLFLLALRTPIAFWTGLALCLLALLPLPQLTLTREAVFATDFTLWQDTLRVNPLCLRAYRNLGTTYLKKGEIDGAIAQYQKAIALDPHYFDVRFNLGITYLQAGRPNEAIPQLQKAVEINPTFTPARHNLAVAFIQTKRLDEAILQLQEIVRLAPNDTQAQRDLAQVEAMARTTSAPR